MKRIFTFLLLCAALFACTNLQAQDPIISIQGTLKDANGAAVADGERSVIFRLYHQDAGGTALWEETATVNVIGGIYSHNLGSVTDMAEDIFAENVFLGVEVGGIELAPRTEMTYAPYALSVLTAQRIAKGACSGQVGDIKYSILNPTQFAEENGECWVPMDGRAIPGTALAGYGHANVPDMSGLFLRATEYNDGNDPGRSPLAVATLQTDENKSHRHDSGTLETDDSTVPYQDSYLDRVRDAINPSGGYSSTITVNRSGESSGLHINQGGNDTADPLWFRNNLSNQTSGNHSHDMVGETGWQGDEARPKNMNFFIYIRVD